MKTKFPSLFLPRIVAVFLSVCLALPSPALALRVQAGLENNVADELAADLGQGNGRSKTDSAPAAGLEENPRLLQLIAVVDDVQHQMDQHPKTGQIAGIIQTAFDRFEQGKESWHPGQRISIDDFLYIVFVREGIPLDEALGMKLFSKEDEYPVPRIAILPRLLAQIKRKIEAVQTTQINVDDVVLQAAQEAGRASLPVDELRALAARVLKKIFPVSAAGLEAEWQNQMWEVLAEGFSIRTQDLRKRLQPTDLLDFRRSFGPEELGPKIDLYARILVGTDVSAQTRQRMIDQLEPLIEPPPVYPEAVVKSFEELSRAETVTEFDARLAKFVSTIRTELPRLSPDDPARAILERLTKEGNFTPEQQGILRTVAERVVKAFHPEFGNDRVETYARWLLSNTRPASLRSIRSILPAWISRLREKYQTKEDWASAAIDDLLSGGAFFPESAQILLPLVETQDDIGLANFAAHEYGHALLLELEHSDGQGQTHWGLEHQQGESFSHADWITEGLAVVMDGWLSLDRGEAIPMPKTVTIWFYERAQQLVDEPEQVWIREWRLLENLPFPIRRYVQGVMMGAVAEAVGRKVTSQQVDGNPYQVAAAFLAWYAKQPMEESVPRVEEMARAVQAFLAQLAAGLEMEELDQYALPVAFEGDTLRQFISDGVRGAEILNELLQSNPNVQAATEAHQLAYLSLTEGDFRSASAQYASAANGWGDALLALRTQQATAAKGEKAGLAWVIDAISGAESNATAGMSYAGLKTEIVELAAGLEGAPISRRAALAGIAAGTAAVLTGQPLGDERTTEQKKTPLGPIDAFERAYAGREDLSGRTIDELRADRFVPVAVTKIDESKQFTLIADPILAKIALEKQAESQEPFVRERITIRGDLWDIEQRPENFQGPGLMAYNPEDEKGVYTWRIGESPLPIKSISPALMAQLSPLAWIAWYLNPFLTEEQLRGELAILIFEDGAIAVFA